MNPIDRLRAAITDRDAWSVYADWLQTQGDPAGELCALQLLASADPRITELEANGVTGAPAGTCSTPPSPAPRGKPTSR